MNKRNEVQLAKSRAKNPDAGEVVVEVRGIGANSFCYRRNGAIAKLQVKYPRLLGWLPFAKNPKLVLFKGETIVLRISDKLSYVVTKQGLTEIKNDHY